MESVSREGLSANALKVIAILAMTVDHIAWAFVPTLSAAGQAMHVLGRLTAPIMCFFIVEGYRHTRSVPRYALRLGIFALVSQVPFSLFENGVLFSLPWNMIGTLLLCLLAVWARHRIADRLHRGLAILALCFLAILTDWSYYAVAFCLIFDLFRENPAKRNRWMVAAACLMVLDLISSYLLSGIPLSQCLGYSLMQLGVLLSLPLLSRYNGKKGRPLPGGRWFFYFYYPLHLLAIAGVQAVVR